MAELKLLAKPRQAFGKNNNRRLRAKGAIPAIAYGGGREAQALELSARELERVLHKEGAHAIIDLEIEGAGEQGMTMLGQLQRDPVTQRIVHADLLRVRKDVAIHAAVEVVPLGTAVGVREGGILERPTREVSISCLPLDLPKAIEVDVSELRVNASVHARDLKLGERIHLLSDPETVLFHVVVPRAAVEAPAAVEEAAAEVEEGEPAKAEEGKEIEK